MPATSLRCRACSTEHPLGHVGTCTRCFGPLDPVYDLEAIAARDVRAEIEAGPRSLWRYEAFLPTAAPTEQRVPPGLTPLVGAPRLADELGLADLRLKLDTANPTHSFKDRVVAVATAKAQELGLGTIACSSTGNLAGAVAARAAAEGLEAAVFCPASLEPEKLVAASVYGATIYAVDGTYDDCSRLTVELSFDLDWGFVNVGLRSYYAEGSKTIAFELAEELGWTFPDVVVCPIASGAHIHKLLQGFQQLQAVGLVDPAAPLPRLIGGQAEGCAPVATAFASGEQVVPVRPDTIARSLAIGAPSDGNYAVKAARETGGWVHSVPEAEIGPAIATLAETTGIFGETATGVTLGALRAAVEAGQIGADERVVLLVTGDGLKTPGAVAEASSARIVPIAADADALLETLGAAA